MLPHLDLAGDCQPDPAALDGHRAERQHASSATPFEGRVTAGCKHAAAPLADAEIAGSQEAAPSALGDGYVAAGKHEPNSGLCNVDTFSANQADHAASHVDWIAHHPALNGSLNRLLKVRDHFESPLARTVKESQVTKLGTRAGGHAVTAQIGTFGTSYRAGRPSPIARAAASVDATHPT
jgi:hypothetical protein